MGTQSIVHGRILLNDNFLEAQEFIQSLSNEDGYPQINSEMFGLSIADQTFYIDPVLVFGAAYKAVEYDWTSFILKFEYLLRSISFETAKIQLETEFMGTFNFFWKSKDPNDSFKEEEKLIETDEWFFGFGIRSRWGQLDEELQEHHIFDFERFKYPIVFTKKQLEVFNEIIKNIEVKSMGEKHYPYQKEFEFRETYDLLFPILSKLSFEKKIEFGFDEIKDNFGAGIMTSKGFYLIKKVELKSNSLL